MADSPQNRCARVPGGVLFALAAAGAPACGARTPAQDAQGVLVIAIDALRADHLSACGYDHETSPTLAAFAAEGVSFRQTFSSAPELLPAHAALLTGSEPTLARRFLLGEFEGLTEWRWRIPARVPHLAVELLAAGYATAAFVDQPRLSDLHGFDLGFQRYEILEQDPGARSREGDQTARAVDRFLQWLQGAEPGRPWFAYLHFNELDRFWSDPEHESAGFFAPRPELSEVPPVGNTDSVFFAVPRSRWRGGARSLGHYEAAYDCEIRAIDEQLERLFRSLRHLGRFESTTIHVLGSFGLQFGEDGLYLRAGRYSQADLAVPWITRPRRGIDGARGRRVDALTSTLDLAPTVLELEGIAVPPGMHGRSQAAALRDPGAPAAERPFVYASCGVQEGCALIGERYTLEFVLPRGSVDAQLRRSWFGRWTEKSATPEARFYDRIADPHPSLEPVERSGPDEEQHAFRGAAMRWLRDMNDARAFLQSPVGRSGLDPATIQGLRTRGVVGPDP